MRIANCPFRQVIRIVKKRYPRLKAKIVFVDEIPRKGLKQGACGVTIFPKDGSVPRILISAGIPVWGAVEVLAHELAHVIVGEKVKRPHGPEWRKTFNWIHREFCKAVEG